MKKKKNAGAGILLFFILITVGFVPVLADTEQSENVREAEDLSLKMEDSLLEQMDLEEVQEAVDELLGETGFSVWDSVKRLADGEDVFSGTGIRD